MIVVRMELWPHGSEARKRSLGTLTITNDGTGTDVRGNYQVSATTRGDRRLWREGRVEDWPRKRKVAWRLLCTALEVLCGRDSCLRGGG
jgi:hypothetical protein